MITVKYNTANLRSIDLEGIRSELKEAFPGHEIKVEQILQGAGYVASDTLELEAEVNKYLDKIESDYLDKV